jgi:hypothetical protein
MGQTKLVSLRLAIPTMLFAAVVAAGFTYLIAFIAPSSPVEADHRPPPTASSSSEHNMAVPMRIGRPTNDEEKAVAAFQRAADEILKRAANLQASVATGDLPIGGKVPLPRKRPIPRP